MIEALYIHIPFCQTKCEYCDFISYTGYNHEFRQRYIEALKKEVEILKKDLRDEVKLKSIFLGGGTPTCLAGGLLCDLLFFIKEQFPIVPEAEISIEGNPGTLSREKVAQLKQGGFNRFSLGVQTFDSQLLRTIGRHQEIKNIYQSFQVLREEGFGNINLDLMYGLPKQTLKQWENTLLEATKLNPEHISLYQLKIEEGTPLGNKLNAGIIAEFDDGMALEMYKLARTILKEYGYGQYEISSFAKPGCQCIHNKTYWLAQPYIGIGAAAHSYLPPKRLGNMGNIEEYLQQVENNRRPPREEETQDLAAAMSEYVFMGLRLIEGINLKEFENIFQKELKDVFPQGLEKSLGLGLLEVSKDQLRLTEEGIYLGNLVFQEFV